MDWMKTGEAARLIKEREKCTDAKAKELLLKGLQDGTILYRVTHVEVSDDDNQTVHIEVLPQSTH